MSKALYLRKILQLWKFAQGGTLIPHDENGLVTMAYPRTAQRLGGRAPATESQKQAARNWTVDNEPWRKSSGPVTALGRCVSSQNSTTHGLYRALQVVPRSELKKIWRDPFYRAVERRMGQLQAQRDRDSVAFKKWLRVVLMPEFLRRTNGHQN